MVQQDTLASLLPSRQTPGVRELVRLVRGLRLLNDSGEPISGAWADELDTTDGGAVRATHHEQRYRRSCERATRWRTPAPERRDDAAATNDGSQLMPGAESSGAAATTATTRGPWTGRSWIAFSVAVHLVATVVMTWPVAAHPRSATVGYPDAGTVGGIDPLWGIWANRWVQHQLLHDPRHLFDANIFYPLDHTLGYSDAMITNALLTAPITLLSGDPVLVNSLLVLAMFPVAALGMQALVQRLAGNRAAALLCGLGFAFLPFRFAHLRHVHLLGHAWTPWVLLALLMLAETRSWRWALGFGLLLATQALTSVYLMFQVLLPVGGTILLLLLVVPRAGRRRFLLLVVAGLALAAALIVPSYLPYLAIRDEQGLQRTIYEAEYWKAMPASHLLSWESRFWRAVGLEAWARQSARGGATDYPDTRFLEQAIFSGGLASLGALAGLLGWRRRPMATLLLGVIGVGAFVLSLGPSLGPRAYLPVIAPGLPLPFGWLFRHVPFFTAMRVSARFGVLVNLTVVGLAGLGVAWGWQCIEARHLRLPRWSGPALTAGLALLLLGELWPGSVPVATLDRRTVVAAPYHWLAGQPDGPVMEFPATLALTDPAAGPTWRRAAERMYWSTISWKPLVNGYSGAFPPAYMAYLSAFERPLAQSAGTEAAGVSAVDARTAGLLQDIGVRYVIVHRDQYPAALWPELLLGLEGGRPVLEPAATFGDALIYRVQSTTEPPPLRLTLATPTRVSPGGPWQPTLRLVPTVDRPAVVAVRRPLALTVVWRNGEGEIVQTDQTSLGWLPAVVAPPGVECALYLRACQPPGQETFGRGEGPAAPTGAGAYTVEVTVEGRVGVECQAEVEVGPGGAAGGDVPCRRPRRREPAGASG